MGRTRCRRGRPFIATSGLIGLLNRRLVRLIGKRNATEGPTGSGRPPGVVSPLQPQAPSPSLPLRERVTSSKAASPVKVASSTRPTAPHPPHVATRSNTLRPQGKGIERTAASLSLFDLL